MSSAEVFALDIGTRKIAGLLMSPLEQGFKIEKASMYQQLPGAMADGQIHHIDAVANIILKIKADLEKARGKPLKTAAVAAAGRSLITQTGSSTLDLPLTQRFCADRIRTLELDAVWDAIGQLSGISGKGVMDSYLCVGYSVIQYYLDGEPIGSLLNHQGKSATAEVIATFLPRIVIDSLDTALENAGLLMESLTLEPIAAMHIVVPPTMRMLNLALVDVGAGTSDLAISAQGTIKDYGMVSYAGDAITAGIAEHFLLDSKVAERVKVQLQPSQSIECTDVFGNTLMLAYEEVLEVILPKIRKLAKKIAHKILELNGAAPKGVILVGGGSLTPKLTAFLAEQLDLPQNLVRMRERSSLENIQGAPEFSGPQVITPIGIGATYLNGRSMHLIRVTVNEQRLQLLKKESSTVGDALLHAGIVPAELAGRPGPAYTIELNGRCITLPGTPGQLPIVMKNGEPTEIGASINDGDQITVKAGKAGKPPWVTLGELTEASAHSFQFRLNGSALDIKPQILVNGKQRPLQYVLQDRDKIDFHPISTFKDLFEHLQIPLEKEIPFYFNNQSTTAVETVKVLVNGAERQLSAPLTSGLNVEYYRDGCTLNTICRPKKETITPIAVTINGQEQILTPKVSAPTVNGRTVDFNYTIKPYDRVEYKPLPSSEQNSYIVTDIFRDYIPDKDFLQRGGLILVNDQEAGFTTPIKDGDVLRLIPYAADKEKPEP